MTINNIQIILVLQYLVAYGLLVQLAVNVAWRVDGSEFSVLQVPAADYTPYPACCAVSRCTML